MALNAAGHRTAGNQGNRPFSRDTVRDMLQNRFYLGELPDGNNDWIKGKHQPFIFLGNVADAWKEASQEQRNKLASALFEEVWIQHNRIVGIKPRPELQPFFQLSYEEYLKSSTCQLETPRGR